MKVYIVICLLLSVFILNAQSNSIPVNTYKGTDAGKPLIFYISGDGGWNSFSTSLATALNKEGYSVISLNSKSYFWSRKTPQQAANDIAALLNQYMKSWNNKSFVLIGYSFGADVTPFIQNKLPQNLTDALKHTLLMSASKTTDFEVHVLGMIGVSSSNGQDVPSEINKITKPVTLLFGSDEKDFPIQRINNKNCITIRLAGGHHYDGNINELVKTITYQIK